MSLGVRAPAGPGDGAAELAERNVLAGGFVGDVGEFGSEVFLESLEAIVAFCVAFRLNGPLTKDGGDTSCPRSTLLYEALRLQSAQRTKLAD
ncbi:hypothetical protein MRX96_054720 [Rhipicephalus microplus]